MTYYSIIDGEGIFFCLWMITAYSKGRHIFHHWKKNGIVLSFLRKEPIFPLVTCPEMKNAYLFVTAYNGMFSSPFSVNARDNTTAYGGEQHATSSFARTQMHTALTRAGDRIPTVWPEVESMLTDIFGLLCVGRAPDDVAHA